MTEQYLTDTLSGRLIRGSSIQKYKDDNLLPVLKSDKPAAKPAVKTDSLPSQTKVVQNQFNKTATKPRSHATAK
ncbi:hypothetical protein D9M68_848710 [compost metagenome]